MVQRRPRLVRPEIIRDVSYRRRHGRGRRLTLVGAEVGSPAFGAEASAIRKPASAGGTKLAKLQAAQMAKVRGCQHGGATAGTASGRRGWIPKRLHKPLTMP